MKGIILKPWEAEAFVCGRKNRITRVLSPQPPDTWEKCEPITINNRILTMCFYNSSNPDFHGYLRKIPYEMGDILYGKEKWCNVNRPEIVPEYAYFADTLGSEDYDPSEWEREWRSSIHMPFEAARIFLRVIAVKVERLHNIGGHGQHDAFLKEEIMYKWGQSPFNAYMNQWNRDHPNCIYASNPWVWVYGVEQITKEEAYE